MTKLAFLFEDGETEAGDSFESKTSCPAEALWKAWASAVGVIEELEFEYGTIDTFGGEGGGIDFQSSEIKIRNHLPVLVKITEAFAEAGIEIGEWKEV